MFGKGRGSVKKKRTKTLKKSNILIRVFRFFLPKDWWGELTKGISVGEVKGKGIRKQYDNKKRRK